MIQTLQLFWREILDILRKSLARIVAIHFVFVCLSLILFAPLTGILGQFLLKLSGKTVLSNLDIAYFFLTPSGALALVLFSSLLLTITIFEQSAMMAICQAVLDGRYLSFIAALHFSVQRMLRIFLFAIHLILRLLLLTMPFLGLALAIVWVMLRDYDINYYLATQPPSFLFATAAICLALTGMMLVLVRNLVSWSLSLPLLLFKEISPAASFAKSEFLCHGKSRFFLIPLASLVLSLIILNVILMGLVQLLGSTLAPYFLNSTKFLIPLLGALATLLFLGNFLLTTFGSGGLAALLSILYRRSGVKHSKEIVDTAPKKRPQRLKSSLILTLLLLAAITSLLMGNWLLSTIPADNNTMIIAHRGAAGKAPENTMVAMRHAMQDGADWLEIDVQESLDGEVVVIHDSDFMKLAGLKRKVWNSNLAEIQKIDVGSWFNAGFAKERVPTLRDVLLLAKGKCRVLIELKYYGHDLILEQRVAAIVEEVDMVDQVAIMSLNYTALNRFRRLRPNWSLGLLSSKTIGKISNLDVNFLALNMATTHPALIRRIQATGRKVYIWTVNDRAAMARLIALGVDGIITDEPAMAYETRQYSSELTGIERLLLHATVLFDSKLTPRKYRDQSP